MDKLQIANAKVLAASFISLILTVALGITVAITAWATDDEETTIDPTQQTELTTPEPSDSSTLSPQATEGWTTIDYSTCEYQIEANVLRIRPENDAASGELNKPYSGWPWQGQYFTSVEISGTVIGGTDLSQLFYEATNLQSISGLTNLNTANTENMSGMFHGCSSLASLDLSNFNTPSLTNMSNMFNGCSSLTGLNLGRLTTSGVTNMGGLFSGCSSLTSLDLNNFNTSSVTNMSNMFLGCSSLATLNVKNFSTDIVGNMNSMFMNCSALTTLDLSSFETPLVSNMSYMFYGCSSLQKLNISKFDTNRASNRSAMFQGADNLDTITIGENFTAQSELPNKTWYNASGESFTSSTIPPDTAGVYTTTYTETPGPGDDPNNEDPGTDPGPNPPTPNNPTNPDKSQIYRLYNPSSGEHMYSSDSSEYSALPLYGWRNEGLAWIAPAAGLDVYRLYNPNSNDHHYTASVKERDYLISLGWKYEGVSCKSGGDTRIFRMFNPYSSTGTHLLTIDYIEALSLTAQGWSYEGVGLSGL